MASSVPTLSQIEAWDVTHLHEAAEHWTTVADAWLQTFTGVREQLAASGWEGQARDAAVDRADGDLMQMRGAAWRLQDAATVARAGASDLTAAKQRVLSAVDDARAAGFEVREDLTVNAYVRGRPVAQAMALQPQANALTAEIRAAAAGLAELDQQVATKITSATAGVHGFTFPPEAPDHAPYPEERDVIQAVDFKQSPEDGDRKPTLEGILERYQVTEDPDGMVDWEPPWPASIFTDAESVTAGEARMLDDLGLLGQRDMQQIKEAARAEANSRFAPPSGNEVNNHNDAFRHAYWNALMTQRFGEEWTGQFTTAHERLPDNNASNEAMDLWNNEVGRRIAAANPDASPEQLAGMVEQAVRNGETVVIRPDGQGVIWSNEIPVGGPTGDSSGSVPVPGNAPGPVPIPHPRGGYDPGQPGGYGTTAGGY